MGALHGFFSLSKSAYYSAHHMFICALILDSPVTLHDRLPHGATTMSYKR